MKPLLSFALGLTLPVAALAQDTPKSAVTGTVPFAPSILVEELVGS